MKTARSLFTLGVLTVSACREDSGQARNANSIESRSRAIAPALPADPERLAQTLGVPVDSLRAAGEERYSREAFDSAQAIWRVEITRAQRRGDKGSEARARMWIGLAAYRLGDYALARREGEAALEMKRRSGLDAELSRSFNALGLLAWNEGRYRDALASFDSAVASARRNNDAAGIARATANIPLVQVELGDYDGARRGLNAALAAGRAVQDDRLQGNALANLGMLDIRLGRASAALPKLASARAHYRAIEYATGEANALGQLATAWGQLGDIQQALAMADSALTIARAEGLQQEAAAELEVIADLNVQAGNPRLALRNLREADSINAALGLAVERGINLRRISSILAELGEGPAAVARARDALEVHRKANATAEIAYDRMQLARSLSLTGDQRSARAEADSATAAARSSRNPAAMREAAAVSARLALDRQDPEGALEALAFLNVPAASTGWQINDLRAQALLALKRLDEARISGEQAVEAIERERASIGVGPLRAGYLQSRAAPFSNLVAIQLARGDTGAAFTVAASLAGRSLSERVGGMTQPPAPLASVAEGERILLRVSSLERALSDADAETGAGERRAALNQALSAARANYEAFLARTARSPILHAGARAATLASIQSRLAEDEAAVVLVSGPTRLDVFVVRRGRVQHHSAPISDRALALRVRVAREVLGRERRDATTPTVLTELYDLLLEPVDRAGALDGASRIVVIPHASLGALPFAGLWNRRSGKFLVEERVIRYLPSVAGLLDEDDQTGNWVRRLAVFAPIPDSLPGTRLEAETIRRGIPGTAAHVGAASTERGVRSALGANRPVHIASHGIHNLQNPLFSRMTVGRAGTGAGANDGRLEVHEILGLTTKSPLVFLSGCETGLVSGAEGRMMTGADETSLSQALLLAGARSVVATLWRVDDRAAARIAGTFYGHLRRGSAPDAALALTQRAALKGFRDYTWAAYAASGSGM